MGVISQLPGEYADYQAEAEAEVYIEPFKL